MKNTFENYKIAVIAICATLVAFTVSCSDVSKTQQEFLDRGENIYVGKLDSVIVCGGYNRAVIIGKNTFLRTAKQCLVTWVDLSGNAQEQIFDLATSVVGNKIRLVVSPLKEGDYQFFVQTIDAMGNKSLRVECYGASYADEYANTQPKIRVTAISVEDDGATELTLSKSPYATRCEITYEDTQGAEKTKCFDELLSKVTLSDWSAKDKTKIKIRTYILPEDKLGVDELALEENTQTITHEDALYNVDKARITVPEEPLTLHSDEGKGCGAAGVSALFDNKFGGGGGGVECWSNATKTPMHFCFDLGKKTLLSKALVVGRDGYPGWDLVKFEIWGRETIEDGPSGTTGYKILSSDQDEGFETEALTRQWKRVGKGWFKYSKPRPSAQTSTCELTELDHSFKPRYIMLRVMSVLTPDVVPVPEDNYYGEEGGFYTGDGVNDKNRSVCIGELSFKASGIFYHIE